MRRWTGSAIVGLIVGLALLEAGILTAAVVAPAMGRTFTFDRLNREYTNEVTEAQPVEQGGIRLQLTSPHNRVRLTRHQLRLTPLPDGSHQAVLEVEFEGDGQVEAEISIAGVASRLTDHVAVPLQSKTFEGRVAIERTDAGYVFTALELPERVTVVIESQLAGRFLQTCKLMGALLPLDCNALGALLSHVVLPMPEPGGAFLLPAAELTDEDRRSLNGYLGLGG